MTNVDELLKKAKDEIRKAYLPQENKKQETATNVLENSVEFADNVLKRLVAHTLDKELDELFDDCIETRASILIKEEKDGKVNKYTLSLDIVDHDYMLDLKQFKDSESVKERMVFLLNTVKVLYCPIKDYMKKLSSENDEIFNYVLQIGLNTTLFLDKDSKKRIGIVLTPVN